MNRCRHLLLTVLSILIGLALPLLAAELLLRLLPVTEGMRVQPVSAASPVFRMEPNRDAVYAKDWNFSIVNKVRTNSDGFISDQEYRASDASPLLALVGDSYVEALMVPYAETLQGRLAQSVAGKGRVYAFAASGAGFAQYLIWARHARDTYAPKALTIVVISNDFSESLAERERSPGFHSFVKGPDGHAQLSLMDYHPSLIRRIMRESALAMYLFSQIKIQSALGAPLSLGAKDTRYVGNIAAISSEKTLADSRWATDEFLRLLPEYAGLPPERIQLVVEAVRPEIYEPSKLDTIKDSFWVRMRDYVIAQGRGAGFEVIDLNPVFMERYARDGKRFEFPTDGHWNGEGHGAAADAVKASRVYREVFGTGR